MIEVSEELAQKIQSTVEELGFYLYYIDQEQIGNNIHLIIYINKAEFSPTISLDDCVVITRAINEYIDDYLDEEYMLEISSAGINRRLSIKEHYQSALNEKIEIVLNKKVEPYEKKKIMGIITKVEDEHILLDNNLIEYKAIKRANYVGEEK